MPTCFGAIYQTLWLCRKFMLIKFLAHVAVIFTWPWRSYKLTLTQIPIQSMLILPVHATVHNLLHWSGKYAKDVAGSFSEQRDGKVDAFQAPEVPEMRKPVEE